MDIPASTIARNTGIVPNERALAKLFGQLDKEAEARRKRRKNRRRVRPESRADVHECEVYKVIAHVFGVSVTLPDDDYGRDVLYEVLNQMALRHADIADMRDVAIDLLPEIDDDDSFSIMIKEIGPGRRRRADQLARILGVTYKMRVFLDLRGIGACDVSKKWRDAIQRQKEAADKRWMREQAGHAPHAQSAARNKPWLELGISESTYYARLAKAKKAAAKNTENSPRENTKNSSAENVQKIDLECFGSHPFSDSSMDKSLRGDPPAGPRCDITGAEIEHAGEATDHIGRPSLPQPDPNIVMTEPPATDGAEFSDKKNIAAKNTKNTAAEFSDEERARRHLQAVASAVARSPDPVRWQHLIVAASIAWLSEKTR